MEHRHSREEGSLIYPVYSRRSGGLSVGINLFPDRKLCSFDCPYCEVFPFDSEQAFSLPLMEKALVGALAQAKERDIAVCDICFSGNGEPTLSSHFPAALEAAFRVRDREASGVRLALITNGSGLLDEGLFELLCRAGERGLCIWLKLDAGTPLWYKAASRSAIPFERLIEKIRAFVKRAPVTLQTMICAINGTPPSPDEARAWEALVAELACAAAELREVQIYGKARPAPEDPLAACLPTAFLEARAASLRAVLASVGKETLVKVYP
ncbi:MAG: radical SAM protein [Treponema sp.]|nr:radical SAM protein [Treponema sp.]